MRTDGIWIVDADAKTLYANSSMAEILGTTPEELAGTSSFAYLFQEDESTAQKLFEGKKQGENGSFHFRLKRKDGTPPGSTCKARPCETRMATSLGWWELSARRTTVTPDELLGQPQRLSGDPVEVESQVTVSFTLAD
jgi:PAS domain-containing protein